MPKLSRRSKILIWVAVAILIILLVGPRLLAIYTDWLWFKDLNYQDVFTKIIWTRIWLFVITGIIAGAIVFASLFFAFRWRPVFVPANGPADPIARYRAVVMGHLRWFTWGPVVLVGLIAGLVAQGNWAIVQKFLHGTTIGYKDPQFHLDAGFYAWDLPFYRFIVNFLFVLTVVAFLFALLTHYVFGGIRLAGRGGTLTKAARIQLAATAGIFLILKAIAYWLDRYTLLSSTRKQSIFTGAGYTDINAVLPAKLILMSIAIICAVAFFAGIVLRDLRVPALATVLMLLSALVIGVGWPLILEQFSVKPNAAAKEAEYIGRNIDATKQAYGITDNKINTITDWGTNPANTQTVNNDNATLSNIRILDPNVLSDAFTQLEQNENFYGFPQQMSLDRYRDQNGTLRDYVVSVRELDPTRFAANQQNWINKHTVYTHGDGFIAAPANQVDQSTTDNNGNSQQIGGKPNFLVSDLDTIGKPGYQDSPIQVKQPRIYFGELIAKVRPDYAIVGAPNGEKKEYDNGAQTFTYDGGTGVPLNNWFNRFAYAVKYTERNFLLSGAINKDSKLLYNRDPRDRVKKAAPWLTVDSKTYPAVIDGKIQWIVDGYTTLDQFPYAQKMSLQDATADAQELNQGQTGRTQTNRQVSYVRNSVKATVDAYTGKVTLYQFDNTDPVLKTWMKVFPGSVKPRSDLDKNPQLLDHMRYPEDLFKIQRALLAKYHVSDPQTFFRGNDFWSVPADPTQPDNPANLDQPPYYYIASDPKSGKAQFQLSSAMNALRRDFMASQISVGSDPADYGQFTIRTVGTQTDGPTQSFAAMTTPSDPSLAVNADRKNLENTGQIIWGNLLTLPVGDNGILNVLPMYVKANGTATYPQLYRVLMRYYAGGGKNNPWALGYASTVAQALQQVGINPTTPLPNQNPTQPQGNTNQPTPQPVQPPAPVTPAPGGGAGVAASPQLTAVIGRINSALDALQQAQQNGDYTGMAKAQADLKAATSDYEGLVNK